MTGGKIAVIDAAMMGAASARCMRLRAESKEEEHDERTEDLNARSRLEAMPAGETGDEHFVAPKESSAEAPSLLLRGDLRRAALGTAYLRLHGCVFFFDFLFRLHDRLADFLLVFQTHHAGNLLSSP